MSDTIRPLSRKSGALQQHAVRMFCALSPAAMYRLFAAAMLLLCVSALAQVPVPPLRAPVTDHTQTLSAEQVRPLAEEIDFILETASGYLSQDPSRSDVLSTFAGIRPLVKAGDAGNTSALSREHTIQISKSGLLTIAGGKWTTYRRMAEDAVNHAATLAGLEERPCATRELRIHGHHASAAEFGALAEYGADAPALLGLVAGRPDLDAVLDPALPVRAVQVVWAVLHEMARTLDDVLARRTRALSLDVTDLCFKESLHQIFNQGHYKPGCHKPNSYVWHAGKHNYDQLN